MEELGDSITPEVRVRLASAELCLLPRALGGAELWSIVSLPPSEGGGSGLRVRAFDVTCANRSTMRLPFAPLAD